MSDRSIAVLLGAVMIAGVLGLVLFIGAAAALGERGGETDPRVFFGDRPPPAARTVAQIQERVPGAVRPLVPAQRQVAAAVRDGAGYLLVLIGVAAALVFARGPVVAGYRATLGGWRTQLRALALGGALMGVIASALFLTFVSMLGTVAARGPSLETAAGTGRSLAANAALGPLLQVGVTTIAVAIVLVSIVATIGLAAASWRIGDRLLQVRPLSRIGQSAPPTLVALLGVSVVYVLAHIPVVGPLVTLAAVAYALGVVAVARLAHAAPAAA
ncbi:MAG: hypothetical protein A3G84_06020 [Chloroflexi bacterium RIFCSPLOWO2_12_FULL_71_12]|nr:MAG: hypothetical protein A3G84_06020 [Chloroflexi bacterium RIFCSPLOWO2_12_FULL_71_12]